MNITNYIIEFLKEGNIVEIKGIGSFVPKRIETQFDKTSSMYYPAVITVEFRQICSGNNQIIDYIAKREFVGISTAERLWDNFVLALKEKIENESKHAFPEIGDLCYERERNCFVFTPVEGLNLMRETQHLSPIKNVLIYDRDPQRVNPFDRFDNPVIPEKVEEEIEEEIEETLERVEDCFTEEEEQVEKEVKISQPEKKEIFDPEILMASAKKPIEEKVEQERHQTKEEMLQGSEHRSKRSKKKRVFLVIPLIVLGVFILLGVFYYFQFYKASKTTIVATTSEQVQTTQEASIVPSDKKEPIIEEKSPSTDNISLENSYFKGANGFTFDYNLVEITDTPQTIEATRNSILNNLETKLTVFLKNQSYSTAKSAMKVKLTEYIENRLSILFDNQLFHPSKFINYNDYITQYCQGDLERQRVSRAKTMVQSEIISEKLFAEYLNQLVATGAVEKDKVVPAPPKYQPVAYADIRTNSKQGFDIIAGFFKSRNNAANLAARMRKKGTDAYVITKGNIYYVSLGSAPSQTAAEALLKQLQTWNKENMVIKKW